MLGRIFIAAAVLLIALPWSAVSAQPVVQPAPGVDAAWRLSGIEPVISEALRAWDVPGASVSIVSDGKVVLARGFGTRDPRTGAPMNADTLVPTASLTKAVTGVGLGILVDQDRVSFDAPIRSYVDAFELSEPVSSQEVTVRDLLSHRSGLSGRNDYIYNRYLGLDADQLLARLPHLALSGRPGRAYEYSNAAYVILGRAIEQRSGLPYGQFIERRLFQPLGMRRTTFSFAEAERDSNHAVGLRRWRGRDVYEFVPFGAIITPHGGMISTANDMARWMIMNLDGGSFEGRSIVSRSTLAELHTTQIAAPLDSGPGVVPLGYAMGWNSLVYRGEPTLLHTGGMPGWRTITILVPGKKVGVTLMINAEAAIFYPLAFQLLDRFFDGQANDWLSLLKPPAPAPASAGAETRPTPVGPASSHQLSEFAGRYEHPGFGGFRVRQQGGMLVGEYNGHRSPLVHLHHDVFRAEPAVPTSIVVGRIQFHDHLDGRIDALTFEPFGDARFERRPDERLSDPAYLRRLAGTYIAGDARYQLKVVGTTLVYQRDALEPANLVPTVQGDFLHPRGNGLRISFRLPPTGPATAMVRIEGGKETEIPRTAASGSPAKPSFGSAAQRPLSLRLLIRTESSALRPKGSLAQSPPADRAG